MGDKAPVVLAKGKIAHEIPIIRKEELARAMYPLMEVGEGIPPKFYKAVARQVVA